MMIRIAQPEDAPDIARVHVIAWQAAYRGLLPADLLDNLSINRRSQEWNEILALGSGHTLVCTDNETIVGFVGCGECRDQDLNDGRTGELYAIYLDPHYWSTGRGTALLDAALTLLRQDGYTLVTLWVLAGNQRGIRFYERAGFTYDDTMKVESLLGGSEVEELRYRQSLH